MQIFSKPALPVGRISLSFGAQQPTVIPRIVVDFASRKIVKVSHIWKSMYNDFTSIFRFSISHVRSLNYKVSWWWKCRSGNVDGYALFQPSENEKVVFGMPPVNLNRDNRLAPPEWRLIHYRSMPGAYESSSPKKSVHYKWAENIKCLLSRKWL